MADRFPSLDDFSAGQTEPVETNAGDDEDFLARERAALGDDANQFATATDRTTTVEDADDDLLGGGDDFQSPSQPEDTSGFESSFPAIESQNEQVAPGGSITGVTSTFQTFSTYQEPEEEPEAVREWREKRDADLARRAEASSEKKAATIAKAQEDIDDFYEAYNKRTDKAKAQTRTDEEEFLANREDTSSGGTSWERIAKLVDISGKGIKGGASGSGKERFRELLLDLKKDEKAPGVEGV